MLFDVKNPIRTEPVLPVQTRLGVIRIAVTNAEEALPIWRDVVGLAVLEQSEAEIHLGIGKDVLIVLELGASRRVVPQTTGLYHVAIHVPERLDLARFVVRAIEANVRIAPTDHLVTEAIYLWDRDGNGIEMTFETPWRGTLADPTSNDGVYGITTEGKPHSGREAIDLDDLLKEVETDSNPRAALPEGTRIGHVHVHVNDLDVAMHFYRDLIGFGGLFILREWGLGDVGLDYMPHTIAFNIWAGAEAKPAPEGAAGLRWFTIVVPDVATRDAMRARLVAGDVVVTDLDGAFEVKDPSGNRLRIELGA